MRRALVIIAIVAALAAAASAQVTPPAGEGFLDLREPVITKKKAKKTRIRGRASAGILRMAESQKTPVNAAGTEVPEARLASPDLIQWLDLRGFYEAAPWREDANGFRSLGDVRLRLAGSVPRTIDSSLAAPPPANTTRDRGSHGLGQRGGSEVDLRELYAGYSGPTSLYAGRLIVREADATTIDGVRLGRKLGKDRDYEMGIFGGLAPDPLSRDLGTDYGSGDFSPAFGAGTTMAYRTRRGYGSFGLGGILPSGKDDGDTVIMNMRGTRAAEALRLFLTSNGYFRFNIGKGCSDKELAREPPCVPSQKQLDLYHYAVFDVLSDSGAALRALHAQLGYRPSLRFHAELGYSHMSTIALEVYLFDLLNEPVQNTVQSNLLVQRTARDELRGQVDLTFGEQRVDLYAISRVRRRSLESPTQDPSFSSVGAQTALDITVGARDRRSWRKLRLGASVSAIYDFRAKSTVVHVDVGRDFLRGRLAVDTSFDYQRTVDDAPQGIVASTACGNRAFTSCWGRYSGSVYDFGVTGVYVRGRHWLGLLDYHLIYDGGASDPSVRTATTAQSPILTQVLFLKGQYSF